MAQKLIQPINRARLTASYKWGSAYQRDFGGVHYGQDMTGVPYVKNYDHDGDYSWNCNNYLREEAYRIAPAA